MSHCKFGVYARFGLIKSSIIWNYEWLINYLNDIYGHNLYWIDNVGYYLGKELFELEFVEAYHKSNRGRPKGTGLVESLVEVVKKQGKVEEIKAMSNREVAERYEISFPTAKKLREAL